MGDAWSIFMACRVHPTNVEFLTTQEKHAACDSFVSTAFLSMRRLKAKRITNSLPTKSRKKPPASPWMSWDFPSAPLSRCRPAAICPIASKACIWYPPPHRWTQDAGHFLDTMAGKQVFTMAKNFPAAFWLLSVWQGLMARLAPGLLFRLLFASAAGDDKALVNNREFQLATTRDLKACFVGRVRGYMRDVHAYVRPWNTAPSAVTIETYVWHGAKDNWSPVEMAHYLARTIPGAASIKIFDGASHYSCLYRAAPEICARLSEK